MAGQRDVSGDGGVLLETKKAGNGVSPKPGQVIFGKLVMMLC